MKAIYLEKKTGAESLVFGDIAKPEPNAGEVLVKVHATAVTPTEFQWYPTFPDPDWRTAFISNCVEPRIFRRG